jgi:hypothetical protein
MAFQTISGSDRSNNPVNVAASVNAAGQVFRGVDVFSPDLKVLHKQLTASGAVIPAVAGQIIYVEGIILSSPTAGTVQFSSIGPSTTLAPAIVHLQSQTPLVLSVAPLFIAPVGEAFGISLSGIASLGVIVQYRML